MRETYIFVILIPIYGVNFSTEIINWYIKNKRSLPWRSSRNPYKIWLSEIILQQTRVAQGLPYYIKFLDAFPTVFDLANASEEHVLKLWQGLGYYSRAKNLHATAKYITAALNGVFPNNYTALLNLKGVGDYTASAIASICFNEATPVVDGNVYRVLSRYFNIDIPINTTMGIKYFKTLSKELIYEKDPATYNQAIMEFGAIQCKPKSPDCTQCPLNQSCRALQKNTIAQLPVKLRKVKIKKRFFNYIVLINETQTLLKKRTAKDIWQHLYEFPLVESAEPIEKETLIHNDIIKKLLKNHNFQIQPYNEELITHKLTHQHIYTKFWVVTTNKFIEEGIPISTLKKYPVPVLVANFIKAYHF